MDVLSCNIFVEFSAHMAVELLAEGMLQQLKRRVGLLLLLMVLLS